MKTSLTKLFVLLAFGFALTAFAHDDHSHEKREAGPNGGRVLTKTEPHAELFVTADRSIQITFLDDAGKAIAPANQIVTVTTGERASPTRISFKRVGDTLVSETKLPEGNRLPAVVQIRTNDSVKTERFTLDLTVCKECKLQEYACTCDHDH